MPADLPSVRDRDGFRRRGSQVTRLEGFVDASFAFSLTLLVIFFNELPDSVGELRAALRRVPTFVFCFVMLAMFWAAHNRWSRRYGLEDAKSTVLSLGSELGSHAILAGSALLSLLLSALLLLLGVDGWFWSGLPMWVYALLGAVMPAYWIRRERRRPALLAAAAS